MSLSTTPTLEDVMFAIFEYARRSDGVDSTEGPARVRQRERMFAKDLELRAMLGDMQTHAYAEGRKDEREAMLALPIAEVLWSDPLSIYGRVKWLDKPAHLGALLYWGGER